MPVNKEEWAEGDRVEHQLFGFGTVVGEPVAVVGPDLHARGGVRDAGFRVDISWDDPDRPASTIADVALRKVSSPDARPFSYYDRQWHALRATWLDARREVEELRRTFRPPVLPADLARAMAGEDRARAALDAFVRDEDDGKHP